MKANRFSNFTTLGRIRLLGFLTAFAILYSLASVFLLDSGLIKDWENRFQTRFYLLRSHFSEPVVSDLPLVLVLIDDHSLPVNTSRSPIDRTWLAALVETISSHDPALIAMNILLDRPGKDEADRTLGTAIANAGNVVLRDDPFYPVYPLFSEAALDTGTLKFKLDSSDTVQEVCANEVSCQHPDIFYKKIIEYYQFGNGVHQKTHPSDSSWLKINFTRVSQQTDDKRVRSFPVLRAHDISQLPARALHNKIVLIGTGFPDLYPLFKVPLTDPELMLQETEVIAQVLTMIAGERYLTPFSQSGTGLLLLVLSLAIALVLITRGAVQGLIVALASVILLFAGAGWAFTVADLEVAFVLPAGVLALFTLTALLMHSVQERFFRLTAELNLKQAKIDFLTNELHSHHLFNEFSRLSVMIQHDPKSAKDYLVEFAEMLRSSLKYGDQTMVPIRAQVEYLNSYLNQQRMIFPDKLDFRFNVAAGVDSLSAPWHAFFPLVENAVKYAEGYLKHAAAQRATITIDLTTSQSFVVFTVQNPYDGRAEVVSSKTGLKNLEERLAWAYPNGGYSVDFRHDTNLWTAELRLPIR
jgi:CHASE2 domain-containing sensor protein